jgi:hypothetical protein
VDGTLRWIGDEFRGAEIAPWASSGCDAKGTLIDSSHQLRQAVIGAVYAD